MSTTYEAVAPLLVVSHITVRFGGLKAIDDVSFNLFPGELLGLIGPNGAGKTTCLRSITGVVRAQEGSVTLDGQALDGLAIEKRIRRGLALSQQLVKPLRHLSLLENVALAAGSAKTASPLASFMHVSERDEEARALELLRSVGIAERADQLPGTQPLGVLKRLEMARALALKPRVLLLDEPLAGLNSKEALADKIWTLRAGLNVAALQCQFSPFLAAVPTYNALLRQHSDELGDSFKTFGFATVVDHGIDQDLVAKAWDLTRQLFEQAPGQSQHGGMKSCFRIFKDHDGPGRRVNLSITMGIEQGTAERSHGQLQRPAATAMQHLL